MRVKEEMTVSLQPSPFFMFLPLEIYGILLTFI